MTPCFHQVEANVATFLLGSLDDNNVLKAPVPICSHLLENRVAQPGIEVVILLDLSPAAAIHKLCAEAFITRHVSEPCAINVPEESRSRPSAVAIRVPAWISLPSHRTRPVPGWSQA
jgi:hypothetical protein